MLGSLGTIILKGYEAKFRSAYCSTNEAKPFAEMSPLLHKENPALRCL